MPVAQAKTGGPLLVIGTFPPVPGPATEATLEAVRTAMAAGTPVTTASVRPSAAGEVLPLRGPGAGARLERLRVDTRAESLLLVLDSGVPGPRAGEGALDALNGWAGLLSLLPVLRRFSEVRLLVALDPGLGRLQARLLWSAAHEVLVTPSGAAAAGRLAAPSHRLRSLPEPASLSGLPGPGVTALGPDEVPIVQMPRYLVGKVGRRMLGRQFPRVRHQILVNQDRARRAARMARRLAGRAPGVARHP